MKYVISWRERPAATFRDYEAAQERVLRIFNKDWKMPASFTVHQFVVRVGDYGGYMVVETDQPADIHYFTSVFARFSNSRWNRWSMSWTRWPSSSKPSNTARRTLPDQA
jgi:hypothetical protein